MKKFLSFFLFVTFLFSYSIKDANKLVKEKKYKSALKEYFLIAKDGMIAKYNIGYMYEHGLGVKKDIKVAVDFYRMSADEGFAPAALLVGNAYLKGIGVNKNLRLAVYYYKIAAANGNKEAAKILSLIKKRLEKLQKALMAHVTVRSNVYNDKVYIDGKYVGHTKITVPLTPDVKHSITVKKEGYKSYTKTVFLKPKENETVKAVLIKR